MAAFTMTSKPMYSARANLGGTRVRAQRKLAGASAAPMGAVCAIEVGQSSVMGSSRKQNEDRLVLKYDEGATDTPFANITVFDGHGGFATADWLTQNLHKRINKIWLRDTPTRAVRKAFISADKALLETRGFMGMGERGVGGGKCGATGATVLAFKEDGVTKLLAANVGDSRALLIKDGQPAIQMTVDHVPDSESERERIEAQNPNPRMPLVKFVGGTWRVGGLLALSRAFGDAYMKQSGFNEGIADLGNDYSSGFGVIADPDVDVFDLPAGTKGWLIVSSDGLNANEERGGGGGIENDAVAKICSETTNPTELAAKLTKAAQAAGSTDDISVQCVRLEELC